MNIRFFVSELSSWREVVKTQWRIVTIFSVSIMLSFFLFFIIFGQYLAFQSMLSSAASQVEVIVDVDQQIPEEERLLIRDELRKLPMVKGIEYWPPDRISQYIDHRIFSGYQEFLQKNQISLPIQPLFRVQLHTLNDQSLFRKILEERFSDRLRMASFSPQSSSKDLSASHFFSTLRVSLRSFKIGIVVQSIVLIIITAIFLFFLIQERKKGFHFHPLTLFRRKAYSFFPELIIFSGFFLLITLFTTGVASVLLGHVFLWQAVALFLLLEVCTAIMLFTGLSSNL